MNSRFNDPHRAQRDLLRGCELLGGLPPDVLSELVAASRIVELSANRSLYEAGELIREAHILFNGSVKRVEYGNVIVDLGRGEGIMRRDQSIPRENFNVGDRIRAYI